MDLYVDYPHSELKDPATVPRQGRRAAAPTVQKSRTSVWATTLSFLLSDVVAISSIISVAWIVADHVGDGAAVPSLGLLYLLAPLLCLAYAVSGLYHANAMHPAQELRRVSVVTAVVALSCTASALLTGAPAATVLLVAMLGVLAPIVVPSCRVFFRVLLARASWWGVPVVVVGAGETGQAVLRALHRWPELGLKPVALLHDEPDGLGVACGDGSPACHARERDGHDQNRHDQNRHDQNRHDQNRHDQNRHDQNEHDQNEHDQNEHERSEAHGAEAGHALMERARSHAVPYAIIAMPNLSRYEAAAMMDRYGRDYQQVFVVPDISSAHHLWTTANTYDGLLGYGVRHYDGYKGARFVKRALDLAGTMLVLLLAAPLLLAIPLLIRLDSRGSIFFKQERMGRGGECFSVYKFRTMYEDAEEKLQEILRQDPERRKEYQRYHKLQDDPRVTPVGKWLRRYSLDELPQLLNVLKGDMSLVGPRAYLPAELPSMNGMARTVLQSPPGITGLWQVSGRNNLSFEERVDLDVHYMQNWTPWLDFYILARTIPVVLTGAGAS